MKTYFVWMVACLCIIAVPEAIFFFAAIAFLLTLAINDVGPPRGPRGGGMHDQW